MVTVYDLGQKVASLYDDESVSVKSSKAAPLVG